MVKDEVVIEAKVWMHVVYLVRVGVFPSEWAAIVFLEECEQEGVSF